MFDENRDKVIFDMYRRIEIVGTKETEGIPLRK